MHQVGIVGGRVGFRVQLGDAIVGERVILQFVRDKNISRSLVV